MTTVSCIQRHLNGHWGGDGISVRSIFSHSDQPERFAPLLMRNCAGP
jgi:hypothetical protein